MNIKLEELPNAAIIHIKGELRIENTERLVEIWKTQLDRKPKAIGINCNDLEFIDSSALGTLVKFLRNAETKSINLQFLDMSPSLLNIFRITRLENFFTMTTREKFEKDLL